MQLVLGRDRWEIGLPDRFPIFLTLDLSFAPQRFQRHSGLEFRREPAALCHFEFLRHLADYTSPS